MPTIAQTLKSLFGQPNLLGMESFPLDPRLADMMARTFPVPVVVIDAERERLHWVSPGFLQMSGARPEVLRHLSAREFLGRYFRPGQSLTELYDHRTPQADVEATLWSETGQIYDILGVWMGMQLEPSRPPSLFLLIFQDVSEEKRLQEELQVYAEELKKQVDELTALRQSQEKLMAELRVQAEHLRRLASIVAHTRVMALILDVKGHIVWINRAFEKRLGYSLEEVQGKFICELPGSLCHLMPGPGFEPSQATCITHRLSKSAFEEDIYHYTRNGESFWGRLSCSAILDELGEVQYYVVLIQDITDRKERELELAQRTAEVEASLRYAARLQRAFLPAGVEGLKPYFRDAAIWYQPLEQLSGDFWGYLPVEGGMVVGLGDATGHGVPAALISVYAMTIFYEKIKAQGLNVASILHELMESMKGMFGDKENFLEGFELALLGYEPEGRKVRYVGARRPLWLGRRGQVYIIEGLRTEVAAQTLPGSNPRLEPAVQVISLEAGDRLYLFSDGVVDQLGGLNRERFSRRRLASFLRANGYLPLTELIGLLQEALRTHAGGEQQTDDIVFLALEV